jgi:hypothetical protein
MRTFGPPPAGGNDQGADVAAASPLPDDPAGDVPPDPGRRLVIEGNKAWAAAAGVRRRWLPQLFARRAAPRHRCGPGWVLCVQGAPPRDWGLRGGGPPTGSGDMGEH